MSQQNVDAVKAGYEAFNRRDFDTLFEFYDPEIVWEQDEGFVEPGTRRGHEGVRGAFDSLFDGFENFQIEVREVIDVDDDRVVAVTRVTAIGKGSGVEVDNVGGSIWTLRDEKAVRVQLYLERARAFEEAGLS
jgi:ketosteroid isomerase-like protein